MSNITNAGQPYEVSNSEIQTFKDCRRKWWLAYYRRLEPNREKLTGPLALGSRIHAALELHYTTGEDLLEVHQKLFEKDRLAAIAYDGYTQEIDKEGELGRLMLEGYLDWAAEEGIDSELELVSVEEVITMPLMDGRVILKGKIDQRVRRKSDGVRMFRDFKTVGTSFLQYMQTAQLNEQILTYMVLEQHQNKLMGEDERSEGGIFTLLRKVKRGATAKPPFYEQHEVRHNIFTLRSFWYRLHGVISDLMAVKDALDEGVPHQQVAYPRPSNDCSWKCQFFAICPMFDDGSAVEDAITEQYRVHDPYDYYDPTTSPIEEKGI